TCNTFHFGTPTTDWSRARSATAGQWLTRLALSGSGSPLTRQQSAGETGTEGETSPARANRGSTAIRQLQRFVINPPWGYSLPAPVGPKKGKATGPDASRWPAPRTGTIDQRPGEFCRIS